MDEMRIKSDFTKDVISKLLEKTLQKKLGINMSIKVHGVDVISNNGDVKFDIKIGGGISKEEIQKILKDVI